ncbi:MAG TPA: hypothetical protein VHY37_02395 [Tepidisphaeraceae bacterium]|nr:hypothetical protein [Tepidisphaeraceae bacterium]
MRIVRLLPVIILFAAGVLRAAPTSAPAPGLALPPAAAMERDALLAIDKTLLGPGLAGQTPDAIYSAQQQIERYFSGASADRKSATKALALSGIDANALGKLCHVRMDWPALAGGVYFIDTTREGHPVRYYLGVPSTYDRARPWPMVIKLMSAAELGKPKDPAAVLAASHDWAALELRRHPDALVLVPVYDPKEGFGPSYAGMNDVLQPMLHAADVVNIDPARVYLVGQSEAASAAWNLVLCYPIYFAAFDDFAGMAPADWERIRIMNLLNVLPVVWHDDTDKIVPLDQSTSLVFALHSRKIPVEFVKTSGQGHVPNQGTIDRLYDIMINRARPVYPEGVALRSTRPDTLMNRADWLQVWQPMDGGKYGRVFFHGGPDSMRIFDNPLTAVATCKANRIEATIDNVESLTFFVNDQMIDFSKPLTIEVNHQTKFSGLVTPSVQRMLADQTLLGRGWRYFAAAIDVDLLPPPPTTAPKTQPATKENRE